MPYVGVCVCVCGAQGVTSHFHSTDRCELGRAYHPDLAAAAANGARAHATEISPPLVEGSGDARAKVSQDI